MATTTDAQIRVKVTEIPVLAAFVAQVAEADRLCASITVEEAKALPVPVLQGLGKLQAALTALKLQGLHPGPGRI